MSNQAQSKSTRTCFEINGVYEIRREWIRGGVKWWGVFRIVDKGYAKFVKLVHPETSVVDEKREVWTWKLEPGQYLVVKRVRKSERRYDLYVWHLTVEPNKACWWFWSKTWVSDILDTKPMLQLILEKRLGGSS
jgi:hypothetical protein